MRKLYITLLLSCVLAGMVNAQNTLPWKKRVKMAQDYEKVGDFYQAAVYYEGVYAEINKEEYTYLAGNCYYLLRDYANAAKCLEVVKDKNDLYDKPGYKYALAMKQTGKPEPAKASFDAFIKSYPSSKADYTTLKEACENEIKGCDFALKTEDFMNAAVTVDLLDAKINTNRTEFAPIPFGSDVLYFSSSVTDAAKIYRAQKSGDNWNRPQVPKIFEGKMEKKHFGNGSFSEDGTRFYFTQCDIPEGKPTCGIYLMEKISGSEEWSTPARLPDYINEVGFNTTHPCVVTVDDKEVLYFVSNREGGRGGLDIWFTTRTIGSSGNNYTLPKNLGRNINTFGDEITPYYDKAEGMLYFSSNGRVSAGGLDIFKSKGDKLQWEVAQNLGFPINSSADDLYYIVSEAHGGGYFVSNRLLYPKKSATTDDDIFSFAENKIVVTISGAITDAQYPNGGPLTDVDIKLFNEDELVEEKLLAIAEYRFKLSPKKKYSVEITKEGFNVASFDINTSDFTHSEDVIKNIALEKPQSEEPIDEPVATDWAAIKAKIVPPQYDSKDNPYDFPTSPVDPITGEDYEGDYLEAYNDIKNNVAKLSPDNKVYYDGSGGELLPYIGDEIAENTDTPEPEEEPVKTTTTPVEKVYEETDVAPEGTVYKIQVAAVRKFTSSKYEDLKKAGQLDFEDIHDDIRRVMVVPKESSEGFKSKGEALNVLSYIINNSKFKNAFVIKIVDGERIGEGFRGWEEEEGEFKSDNSSKKVNEDYEGF